MKKIFFLFLILMLTACLPGTPAYNARQTATLTPDQLINTTESDLCVSMFFNPTNENIVNAINSRKLISKTDMELVLHKRAGIGMSLCALRAAWGPALREHRYINASGTILQRVYEAYGNYSSRIYVHLQNDNVVSISD